MIFEAFYALLYRCLIDRFLKRMIKQNQSIWQIQQLDEFRKAPITQYRENAIYLQKVRAECEQAGTPIYIFMTSSSTSSEPKLFPHFKNETHLTQRIGNFLNNLRIGPRNVLGFIMGSRKMLFITLPTIPKREGNAIIGSVSPIVRHCIIPVSFQLIPEDFYREPRTMESMYIYIATKILADYADQRLAVAVMTSPSNLLQINELFKTHKTNILAFLSQGAYKLGQYHEQLEKPDEKTLRRMMDSSNIFEFCRLRKVFSFVKGYETEIKLLQTMMPRTRFMSLNFSASESEIMLALRDRQYVPILKIYQEFEDENRQLINFRDVAVGNVYRPVITTSDGLLRYRMDDRFRATRKILGIMPVFEFLGRDLTWTSYCAEKLSTERIMKTCPQKDCRILTVVRDKAHRRYMLYVQSPSKLSPEEVRCWDESIRSVDYCYETGRKSDLILPLAVTRVPENAYEVLLDRAQQSGFTGNFKILEYYESDSIPPQLQLNIFN